MKYYLLLIISLLTFLIGETKPMENKKLTNEKAKNTIVVFETTMGTMKAELFDQRAPITTDNFKNLINKNFLTNHD